MTNLIEPFFYLSYGLSVCLFILLKIRVEMDDNMADQIYKKRVLVVINKVFISQSS